MKQDYPEQQIALKNPWYLADQFKSQMSTPGRRKIIEYRWRVFCKMIIEWMHVRKKNSTSLKILDAGCGDGINLYGLHQLGQQKQWRLDLHGIDYNPMRIERVQAHHQYCQIKQGSLYQLPFEDKEFDIILCNHVLEHIPKLSIALQEITRVLTTDGLFIVGVPNEGCILAKLRNKVIQRSILKKTDHLHFFTQKSINNILIKSGFIILKNETETFFFPHSYINLLLNELPLGHTIMHGLRKILPSQAGGMIISCILKTSHSDIIS